MICKGVNKNADNEYDGRISLYMFLFTFFTLIALSVQ